MKINKSILGIAAMIVFLASSCTQARYGSLTRKIKATHLTKVESNKTEKQNKIAAKNLVRKKEDEKAEISKKPFVLKAITKVDNKLNTENISKFGNEIEVINQSTKPVIRKKNGTFKNNLNELKGKVAFSKPMKKIEKRLERIEVDSTNDNSSLIRLILIVLLILLVISLVGKFLPILNWILGVLVLLVLICFILQLL